MCVSALINGEISATIPSFIKWVFLLLFILLLLLSIEFNGVEKVLKTLFIAYGYPIVLLILSVLLGESKASESDGSTSYIGGYFHEAVFSIIIFTGAILFLAHQAVSVKLKDNYLIPALLIFTILLAMINYRTTLIAAMLSFLVVIYTQYIKQETISRVVYFFIGLGLVFLVSVMDLSAILDRFAEIPAAIMNISVLVDYPEYYTKEDRQFFSGRAFMWSNYIAEALDGSSIQYLFGQGMDSWKKVFLKYAHNTFVSFFYELGVIGVLLLIALFSSIYLNILKIKIKQHKLYVTGFFLSFTFLNLGTMPIWQMEGIMFFAIIIALIEPLKKESYAVKQATV
jgi:cell division protein FtsW (lipid II flippase)